MFEYQCSRCGVVSYSAANPVTVGSCPACLNQLGPDEKPVVAPPPAQPVLVSASGYGAN
jgi:hypothetical protein